MATLLKSFGKNKEKLWIKKYITPSTLLLSERIVFQTYVFLIHQVFKDFVFHEFIIRKTNIKRCMIISFTLMFECHHLGKNFVVGRVKKTVFVSLFRLISSFYSFWKFYTTLILLSVSSHTLFNFPNQGFMLVFARSLNKTNNKINMCLLLVFVLQQLIIFFSCILLNIVMFFFSLRSDFDQPETVNGLIYQMVESSSIILYKVVKYV